MGIHTFNLVAWGSWRVQVPEDSVLGRETTTERFLGTNVTERGTSISYSCECAIGSHCAFHLFWDCAFKKRENEACWILSEWFCRRRNLMMQKTHPGTGESYGAERWTLSGAPTVHLYTGVGSRCGHRWRPDRRCDEHTWNSLLMNFIFSVA